ncbi:MAG TPA: AMP-binding protein [Streptosporangiaceae bacterium]|jgi:acyl-CoA synthetase (AMP-forming)/AMP-acid ligase II|nr:AMP-binding protein [Streptosporangiaceae bacterium]
MGSVDTWTGYWGRLRPARPAIAVGARILTWGSLADRSSRLAAGLAAEGAGRGHRIGVLPDDPAAVIEVIAACARLGAVAVPLDPASDPGRLRAMVAGAGLWALMTDLELGNVSAPAMSDAGEAAMDEPLLMLHTRGTTTGVPRAATLTHGNVEAVAVAAIAADGLVPPDCVGIAIPPTAPTGLAAVLGALHAGALIRFGDLEELLGDDDQPRPTVLVTTCEQLERPGMTARLAEVSDPPVRGGLRLVKAPGPVREALRRECRSRAIPFGEIFGLAESGGLILQQSRFREPADGLVPVLGQQARVVDATGATAPAGQPGELVLAGSAVAGDGWLHTGDLAVEGRDGSLTILGRQQ